ncbi:MAG: tetratricopeptide repeat protein [Elusimicrobia bacterium]|nr:tetratricopeptide repeat protein [Elusimicrobiota bacterium]
METSRRMALALIAVLAASPLQAARRAPRRAAKGRARLAKSLKPAPADLSQAHVRKGLDGLDQGDYTLAIGEFKSALRLKPSSASYFLLGYSYYQRGFAGGKPETADQEDARLTVAAYGKALVLDPGLDSLQQPYQLYYGLALCHEALGQYEKAIEAYRKAFMMAPNKPMIPLYAARLRYKTGEIAKSSSNLRISLERARLLGKQSELIEMIKTDPAFSVMLQSPAHQEVLKEYEAPKTAEPGKTLVAQNGQKPALGPDLKDSVRDAREEPTKAALRAQDQAVAGELQAANAEYRFVHFRQALAGYEKTLELQRGSGILSPSQVAFVYERMGTCRNKLGLSEAAIKDLNRSIQELPINASAHYQLALAYSVLGRYNDSMRALSQAFKSSVSSSELRKYMLLARTDAELEPVRDLPGFNSVLTGYRQGLRASR